MKTVHEILVDAKAKLLKDGWIQESLGTMSGPNCLRGAIVHSMPYSETFNKELGTPTYVVCENAMGFSQSWGDPDGFITSWNDAPDRTFEDVIARLDKAILETAPKEEVVAEEEQKELVSV